jgi:hypothetical protein
MPVALSNYGVVIGDFDHFTRDQPDNFGKYYHGHIFVRTPAPNGGTLVFECAVDVNKPSGDIQYLHLVDMDASKFLVVPGLADGHHFLQSAADSGALDYIRNPLISVPMGCAEILFSFLNIILKTKMKVWTTNVGTDALDHLESMMLQGDLQKVYVFGARYDNASQTPPQGMHDIHYNQGDPPGPFQHLDAIWQDGGVIVRHQDGRLEGFFVKFATQSLNTDDQGLPI